MKAIVIDSENKKVYEISYDGTLEHLYKLIDCRCFTCVELSNGDTLYVDDEGLYGNPRNFFTIDNYPQPLAGNGVILGTDHETGESKAAASTVEDTDKDVIFMDAATAILHARLQGF